jgi:hypothetical protein
MTEACLSELMIDRLIAGELPAELCARARVHAATCADCGGLLRDAEAVAQRFAAAPPPLVLPAPPRARFARGGAAVTALAVGIAIVIAAAWPDRHDSVRVKGGPSLGAFVSHAGELRRVEAGDIVVPGDRLQLVTSTDRAAWIEISAVDGAAARTVYARPQPVLAGRDRPLGFSIILDGTRGRTTITAVFCARSFALDQPPDDCTTDTLAFEVR